MALSWARKRQIMYITGVVVFFLLVSVIVYFVFLYQTPTCSDGVQNQNEVGVDCGGVCERICAFQARPLTVVWTEALPVRDTTFNAVAYIENANPTYEVRSVAYEFIFYGEGNNIITRRSGTTFVPRNARIAIFEEAVSGNGEPIVRTEFSFTNEPEWYLKTTPDPEFAVRDRTLSHEETMPRVQAVIENMSVKTLYDIDAVSIVYDDFGNPIAASRTAFERLGVGESRVLTYTWPQPYVVGEQTCQVPVEAVLVVDRSGSMAFDQENPPQPLTDTKSAAQIFVERMANNDRVGVVTFANTATTDGSLTFNHDDVKRTLADISILDGETQNTNIADGITHALRMLESARATTTARHAVVLLTDGVATRPVAPAGSDRTNIEYAEEQARSEALRLKNRGPQLYTIGLGNDLNHAFLSEIATTPDHYFQAPTADRLEGVYTEIASSICTLGPKIIEIIPRLPHDQY